MARCGRKVSRGFEVGSERFNLASVTAGSVFSANCNPVSKRLGSFAVRDLPLSALGFKTADVFRETFGNFPGAAELYSRGDASIRYGEAEFNVPLGLRFPETPESLDGPGSPAVMLYANSETVRDNLLSLESSVAMEAVLRETGLGFVSGRVADLLRNPPAAVEVSAEFRPVGTFILPPAPLERIEVRGKVSEPESGIWEGCETPADPRKVSECMEAEYDRSPFRGDTSPEIPSARVSAGLSDLPAETPAVPCAETVPAPAEGTSDNPDAGTSPETFACPCGKSYAHRRSLSRHARTCPEAAAV